VQGQSLRDREPDRTQGAQGILAETGLHVTDSTQKAFLKVTLPIERVDDVPFEVTGDSVDGEVPASQVVQQSARGNPVRVATVRVRAFRAGEHEVGSHPGVLVTDREPSAKGEKLRRRKEDLETVIVP
jgi:hypothetical protein